MIEENVKRIESEAKEGDYIPTQYLDTRKI